jgi:hypothetical protein
MKVNTVDYSSLWPDSTAVLEPLDMPSNSPICSLNIVNAISNRAPASQATKNYMCVSLSLLGEVSWFFDIPWKK